jgi:ATP-dependent exoDNAse (exonuclease V) beta subunit
MSEQRFSPEQLSVIETWGSGMAVLAGAGSGKTTTLVAKCVELLKRKPDARLAAVSFTERSAGDLRAKLSLKIGLSSGNHWVMTIHALCAAILREFPREAGFDGEESMLAEPEARALWEQAVQSLWADELPDDVAAAMDHLLARETRPSVVGLLSRVKSLSSFGALQGLLESPDPGERALGAAARFALERYERAKRRRGALDFDDLERGADRALSHAHVREGFHRRFDLVLIDEFQDTNPVQARVIWRFVKPDASNLLVVGDPKQSIYRFRDADVSVFEEFCSRLPERRSLTWNFRSRPGIIEYVNEVCSELFPSSGLKYEALVPKREADPELEPVVRVDVEGPAGLAAFVRAEVARGLPLDQMALLLRKIRGNEKWLRALTAAGIPIAVGSGGLFWEDPRVRELVELLRWWDEPGNSQAGAVFLRAPWVGVADALIDEWIAPGSSREPSLHAPFFASRHPMALALSKLRDKPVRPGEIILATLLDEKTEAELGSAALGLWHRAEELSSRGLDFRSVVQELNRAIREERRERDVPPPLNQGQLPVLTLHGSKGLEFPHVILLDFGKKPRAPETPLLFWDRERGAHLGGRTPEGERDRESEAPLREEERSRELAESKRVFYVALTRARERLVLVCPELEEKELARIKPETAFREDFWRSWLECATAKPKRLEIARVPAALPATTSVVAPSRRPAVPPQRPVRPRHSVTEWNLLSRCPRAYEWTYIRPRMDVTPGTDAHFAHAAQATQAAQATLTEQAAQGPTAREIGTRVHAALENSDFEALRALEAEAGSDRFQAEALIDWARQSPWMAPKAEGRRVWSEFSFELPVRTESHAPEILVGSIDRLLAERLPGPDGRLRYTVIDFKVTSRGRTEAELVESYQTQLDLYAAAVRALDGAAGAPRLAELEAALVHISAGGARQVRLTPRSGVAEKLAREAAAIVAGAAGNPKPGGACAHCDFRELCPEGQTGGSRAKRPRGPDSDSQLTLRL